jgi:hypothetical protein
MYSITDDGKTWLVENQTKLELRFHPRPPEAGDEIIDEDSPYSSG